MNKKISILLIVFFVSTSSTYSSITKNAGSQLSRQADSVYLHITWHLENEHLDSVQSLLDEYEGLIRATSNRYWLAVNAYLNHHFSQVENILRLQPKQSVNLYIALLKSRARSMLNNKAGALQTLEKVKSEALNHPNELLRLLYTGNLINPWLHETIQQDSALIEVIDELSFSYAPYTIYQNFYKGVYYQNQMKADSALKYYFKVRDQLTSQPQYSFLKYQLNHKISDIHSFKFDDSKSIYHYQQCLKILNEKHSYFTYALITVYESLGNFLMHSHFEQAYEYQKRALELIESDTDKKIESLINLAEIYYANNKPADAEQQLLDVEETAKQEYGRINPRFIDIYTRLFIHYYDKDSNIFKALSYLELLIESYELFPEAKNSFYYLCKGILHLETGTYRKALQTFRDGLSFELNEPLNKSPYELPKELIPKKHTIYYQARFVEYLAYVFYLYYTQDTEDIADLQKSFAYYNLLAGYYEEYRREVPEFQVKLISSKLSERRAILNNVEVAFDLYEKTGRHRYLEDAYRYMEKSRDMVLTNTIYAKKLKKEKKIPDSLLKREKELLLKIELMRSDLYKKQSFLKPKVGTDQFGRLVAEHEKIKKLIDDYFADAPANKEMITIKKIQQKLSSKQVLIEYALKPSEFYAIAITEDTVVYHRQKNANDLINDIHRYHQLLKSPPDHSSKTNYSTFLNVSYRLYENLIHPFEQLLSNKEELILIPEDILNTIAFETLIRHKNNTTKSDYATLPYLLNDYIVSYGLSATLYFDHQSKISPKPIYAVAPEYPFKSNSPHLKRSLSEKLEALPALKGAQKEVQFLEAEYNARSSRHAYLTEEAFRSNAKSANILHLAMHSIIDPDYPEYSALILSASATDESDGLLHTYEIMHYDLHNQLVVLSACNTGSGKLLRGEGIFSIAKGFIMAGSAGVITTLWEQNDGSAFELMKSLYINLFNVRSPAVALRNAKINYLQHADPLETHPYYWSGYILIGNPTMVHLQKLFVILLSILITAGLAALGIRQLRLIRRKK